MDKFKDIPVWGIILAFLFAWPVGLVLLILRYFSKTEISYERNNNATIIRKNDRFDKLNKLKTKTKIFKILSIIQFIIAIVFFCALISDFATDNLENIEGGIIVNVLAFAILLPLCITYLKKNNLVKKIETYQNLILIRDIYDTDKLSKYLNVSKNEVLDFVTYMIRERYLELDIEDDKIVKPKEYIDPAQIFSIVCQSCGGSNQYIKGKKNVCEYCGSVLNLNKI